MTSAPDLPPDSPNTSETDVSRVPPSLKALDVPAVHNFQEWLKVTQDGTQRLPNDEALRQEIARYTS